MALERATVRTVVEKIVPVGAAGSMRGLLEVGVGRGGPESPRPDRESSGQWYTLPYHKSYSKAKTKEPPSHPVLLIHSKQPTNKPPVKPAPLLLPSPGCLRRQKLLLLPINHILARPQIRRLPRPSLLFLQQLIPQYHGQVQRYPQIPRDEILVVEIHRAFSGFIVHKNVKVLEDGDEDAEHEREIGAVEAKGGGVGHLGIGDALGAPGAHKVDVRDENGDPGQQAEDGDEVDEVGEDDFGVVFDVEEGDAGD